MLSIFSVPKPFIGHTRIIQRNAIRSWSLLDPGCEIILCGNEPGTEEVAAEIKAKWIREVTCNEYGTPLLNSVFHEAQQIANFRLMCYVNADIILLNDFMEAVKRIRLREFVAVGERWDIDLWSEWAFDRPDWEEQLRVDVIKHGALNHTLGSDYFVFPRESPVGKLPEFVVGRQGWDNWFIFRSRSLGIPVVDITRAVTVVHQNHDYDHVPNQRGKQWEGPEGDCNTKLAGDAYYYLFRPSDATHIITSRGIVPALSYKYLRRRLGTLPVLVPSTRPVFEAINLAGKLIKVIRNAIA
jgi:hypothetical protein